MKVDRIAFKRQPKEPLRPNLLAVETFGIRDQLHDADIHRPTVGSPPLIVINAHKERRLSCSEFLPSFQLNSHRGVGKLVEMISPPLENTALSPWDSDKATHIYTATILAINWRFGALES